MAQKGKIRELQEDLKMSRQAVAGLSKYCDKYKEDIKELECKVKNLTIQNVSKRSELLLAFLTKYIKVRDGEAPSEMDLEILQRFESQL